MKVLIVFILVSFSSVSLAARWELVAQTQDCGETAKVFAKEGERYVYVKHGESVEPLYSRDGSIYGKDKMYSTEFSAGPYTFTQPSVVENNLPKLEIMKWGRKTRCNMEVK